MKIRKKNKLASFAFMTIIFAMIASTAIGVYMAQQYDEEFDKTNEQTSNGLNSMTSALDSLLKALDKLTATFDKMDGTDMNINDWKEASAAMQSKIDEIEKFEKDFIESYNDEDTGLTFADHYQYHFNGVSSVDIFFQLKQDALLKISRAKSLDELNKIVADYKKAVEAVPTKVEKIYSLIEEIEKKGIEVSDFDNYVMLTHIFDYADTRLFKFDPATGYDEHKELTEKFEELFDSFQSVALDAFLEKMSKLPKDARLLTLSDHAKIVKEAKLAFDTIINKGFYTVAELRQMNKTKINNALNLLPDAVSQIAILTEMKGPTDSKGRPTLEGINAAWINAQIEKYNNKTTKIEYNIATKTWINELLAMVKEFDTKVWTDGDYEFKLVTYKKGDYFVQENYDMIKRDLLASYVEKYEKAAEDPYYDAKYFIDNVNKITVVTFDMKAHLDELGNWYKELTKKFTAEQIDFLLDHDENSGVVAAYAKYLTLNDEWDAVVKLIADVEAFVMSKDIRENIDGKDWIILNRLLELDLAPVKEKVQYLIETGHDLTTTIEPEALEAYNYIVSYCDTYHAALARVEAAYEASTNANKDAIKAELLETIKAEGLKLTSDKAIEFWNGYTDAVIEAEFSK